MVGIGLNLPLIHNLLYQQYKHIQYIDNMSKKTLKPNDVINKIQEKIELKKKLRQNKEDESVKKQITKIEKQLKSSTLTKI